MSCASTTWTCRTCQVQNVYFSFHYMYILSNNTILEKMQRKPIHFIKREYRSREDGCTSRMAKEPDLATLQERRGSLCLVMLYTCKEVEGLVPGLSPQDFLVQDSTHSYKLPFKTTIESGCSLYGLRLINSCALLTPILIHYVCNAQFHWLGRRKFTALKSLRVCHESKDDVTPLATRRSNVTKKFWKRVLSEWIRMLITRFVFEWFAGINCIILQWQTLTRRGKTKFETKKWYNLCLQIIQIQACYP